MITQRESYICCVFTAPREKQQADARGAQSQEQPEDLYHEIQPESEIDS